MMIVSPLTVIFCVGVQTISERSQRKAAENERNQNHYRVRNTETSPLQSIRHRNSVNFLWFTIHSMIELLLCLAIDTQINGPGYVNLTLTKGDSVEFTLEEANLESFLVFDSLISGKLSLQIPPFTKAI